jgi:hypothetical protein
MAVVLPEGEDLNEWLAVNSALIFLLVNMGCLLKSFLSTAVDFFNQINMLYGTVTEFCTPQECPCMTAGPRYLISMYCAAFPTLGLTGCTGMNIIGRTGSSSRSRPSYLLPVRVLKDYAGYTQSS